MPQVGWGEESLSSVELSLKGGTGAQWAEWAEEV